MGLIVAGVSVGTYTMTALTTMVVEGRLQSWIRDRQRRKEMNALRNHFIVVGYGRLGQAIAEELHATGVPVCVVEKDADRLHLTEATRRYPLVVGDGAQDDVLRQAGIERARGLAVAVEQNASAIYVTLSARELNPRLTIVTRVDDPADAIKARRAGASSVVSPYNMGGWRIAHELVRPHATSFLDLLTLASYEDIQVDEYAVEADSPLAGRTLGELQVGQAHGVLIVAIRHADGSMVPTPGAAQRVQVGDILIAIGNPKAVRSFGRRVEQPS
jgi:voltage-gated potassium channel